MAPARGKEDNRHHLCKVGTRRIADKKNAGENKEPDLKAKEKASEMKKEAQKVDSDAHADVNVEQVRITKRGFHAGSDNATSAALACRGLTSQSGRTAALGFVVHKKKYPPQGSEKTKIHTSKRGTDQLE